jgi:hypothetical protein
MLVAEEEIPPKFSLFHIRLSTGSHNFNRFDPCAFFSNANAVWVMIPFRPRPRVEDPASVSFDVEADDLPRAFERTN